MKTGFFLAALVQLAAAQPHEKRQDVVTDVQVVTKMAPDVVVFVNQYGAPVSTSTVTEGGAQAVPATHTVAAPAAVTDTAHHHKHHHKHLDKHHKHHHKEQPAPAPAPAVAAVSSAAPPAASPAPDPASAPAKPHHNIHAQGQASSSQASSPLGLSYSPYNADNSCKTQEQVNSDFEQITGYGIMRIYGTDCNQVTTVGNAAKAKGMRLFAGIFDLSDIAGDTQILIDGLKSDWSFVDTISVGNELVNSGLNTPSEVIAALNIVKPLLTAAGFSGSVVTVDTFNALIANPELCQASDYAAANAHAFFDPSCTAANAGNWAKGTAHDVQVACGKKVVITESGWPHQGSPNGAAIPGPSEQAAAISSLKSRFSDGDMIIYTAYDDLWKTNTAYTFGAEQYWGIYPGQ